MPIGADVETRPTITPAMGTPRRTLTQRFYLLVGSAAAVLGAVILAVVVSAISFRDDANRREVLLPASADAVELSSLLVDQLDALTATPPRAAAGSVAERESRERVGVLVGRMERELANAPSLAQELDDLRADIAAWELYVDANSSATDPDSLDEATARLTDRVDRAEALSLSITDRIAEAAATAKSSRTLFLRAVGAAVALALVLLVVGTLALRRLVLIPVRHLSDDVAAVAQGDVDHDIRGEGSRELAELAQSVTRMRARILTEHEQTQRAIDAMDQQAPALAALRTLLGPREDTPRDELDVAGALLPAEGVLAGDWYDIIARPTGLVVAIGDVCGHGVEAGLLAVRTKFALLDAIDLGLHPAAALELAANRFGRDDTFATALVAEIDLRAGTCRYASAGHNPMLLLRADGTVEELERTGPLLGLANGPRPNVSVPLLAGDTLVLYTDGVVEARAEAGADLFESARLVSLLQRGAGQSAAALAELVLAEVVAHCGGRCPDDATIAVVHVNKMEIVARVA
jgi:sigma-B regulation protein RsbU (phosphoserine phosphatase)